MDIKTTTIRRLFRVHFSDKTPLRVAESERTALSETIRQRLTGLRYVSHHNSSYSATGKERTQFVCSLWINLPKDRAWASFSVTLKCNQAEELMISYGREKVLIASVDEVAAFAQACQELAEQRHGRQKKQEKIRDLKIQAILAQVKKLARSEKFAFYARPRLLKLDLYIKLTDMEHTELAIPYNNFEETAPMVRTALQRLREMQQAGVGVGAQPRSPFGRNGDAEWITPESLERES